MEELSSSVSPCKDSGETIGWDVAPVNWADVLSQSLTSGPRRSGTGSKG